MGGEEEGGEVKDSTTQTHKRLIGRVTGPKAERGGARRLARWDGRMDGRMDGEQEDKKGGTPVCASAHTTGCPAWLNAAKDSDSR